MTRNINPDEYAAKVSEIIDAAQRLIYTKGYQSMTIKDIRDELGMSNGAFFHYFHSKQAVLEGFIQRIRVETEKPLLSILNDPRRSAIDKLQGFLATLDQLRNAQKDAVVHLLRVWHADDNAIVRLRVEAAVRSQRAPLLTRIVKQGVDEGTLSTAYPDQAGLVVLSLLQGMGDAHAQLLLSLQIDSDELAIVSEIVATHDAFLDAIERAVGAPRKSLRRTSAKATRTWLNAMRGNKKRQKRPVPVKKVRARLNL